MAVGPNPDSNPGLSDLRRLTNDIKLGPVRDGVVSWWLGGWSDQRPEPSFSSSDALVVSLPVRFVSLGVRVRVYIHDAHAMPSDSSARPHANA